MKGFSNTRTYLKPCDKDENLALILVLCNLTRRSLLYLMTLANLCKIAPLLFSLSMIGLGTFSNCHNSCLPHNSPDIILDSLSPSGTQVIRDQLPNCPQIYLIMLAT